MNNDKKPVCYNPAPSLYNSYNTKEEKHVLQQIMCEGSKIQALADLRQENVEFLSAVASCPVLSGPRRISQYKMEGKKSTSWTTSPTTYWQFMDTEVQPASRYSEPEELSGRPVAGFAKALSRGREIITNGHVWKQQRRFGMMTLRNLGLGKRGLESRIQEEARCLVESFIAESGQQICSPADHELYWPPDPGKPMDTFYFVNHAIANVISTVVFGHRFAFDDVIFQELITSNDYLFQLYDSFPWKIEPNDVIDYYMAQIAKTKGEPDSTFDDANLVQVVIDLFIAGTETTATTLHPCVPASLVAAARTVCMHVGGHVTRHYMPQGRPIVSGTGSIFQHPAEILDTFLIKYVPLQKSYLKDTTTFLTLLTDIHIPPEKVQKELDSVLEGSSPVYYEDRKRLPYTNAVIHEMQRFANISGSGVVRCNVKDVILDGFTLRKDTMILPNLDSVLHDPQYWKTPYQFNENHFLDKDGNFVSNEAFIPFSAGHRVCLGEQLARIELFIFFATLLKFFRFCLPEDVTEVNTDYILGITLKPHPFKICAVPR
ncbi:cytochrome P450 2J6-like [Pelobates cultripes]|uniref:Cytochrome P450 2J6-like n=1 Tax=Pelobates cultripes TaxID=61616 RepID=A0AAD1S721_PELCU|nr:cytochrome P450 2J6-like [Pelobates cultripes]